MAVCVLYIIASMCKRKGWRYGILIVCLLLLVAGCSCGGTKAASSTTKTPFQLLQESHTALSSQVAAQGDTIQAQQATIQEQEATIEELKSRVVLLDGKVVENTAAMLEMADRLAALEAEPEPEGADEGTQ